MFIVTDVLDVFDVFDVGKESISALLLLGDLGASKMKLLQVVVWFGVICVLVVRPSCPAIYE